MQSQSTTPTRFWIENLIINKQSVAPNENPNKHLTDSSTTVNISFNPFKNSLVIDSDMIFKSAINYKDVKLIRDTKTAPSEYNKNIELACLLCVTNDQFDNIENFSIGPVIERSKKLNSFPGKLSFVGGLFELNDLTPEHTVIREFIEELDLKTYLDFDIIKHIKKKMKLTHLIFSHPLIKQGCLINDTRRFNITFVYSIALPNFYLNTFKYDIFQKSEVDSVITFKGIDILKSLISNPPFEIDKGWTINCSMIVLDQLKEIAKNQSDTLIKNGIHPDDPLVNVLSLLPTTEILSESDLQMVLRLCIQQLYILLSQRKQVEKPKVEILNPLKKKRQLTGALGKLSYISRTLAMEYTLTEISIPTDVSAVAMDMLIIFLNEDVFIKEFVFYGYESNRNFDNLFRERKFHEITDALRQFIIFQNNIEMNVIPIAEGGIASKQRGWIISLQKK